MAKSLEEMLRESAKSGSLNHLSISYLHGGGFEVAYRGAMHADHRRASDADVVVALIEALSGRKTAAPKPVKAAPKAKTAPAAPPARDEDSIFGDLM